MRKLSAKEKIEHALDKLVAIEYDRYITGISNQYDEMKDLVTNYKYNAELLSQYQRDNCELRMHNNKLEEENRKLKNR